MVRQIKDAFILDTDNTTYAFAVHESGYLEHLYYGRKIRVCDDSGEGIEALMQKREFAPGNSNVYRDDMKNLSLSDIRLEFSANGKGDDREPFIEVVHADGSRTSDFVYESAVIVNDKKSLASLPSSRADKGQCSGLVVTLVDRSYDLTVELSYYVFESCDVITRSARLINTGSSDNRVLRLMSMQMDTDRSGLIFTTFNGAWIREMGRVDHELVTGKVVNESVAGASSSAANPFVMFSDRTTGEDSGKVYAFNLIYSGNHTEIAQINEHGRLRFLSGINPKGFEYRLGPKESFEAPEAVMTFSNEGFNGMSYNMHRFVSDHILRGEWAKMERPVLLNSWEAAYFDITEFKLLRMARKARSVGIEMFVMDDGWFGKRNDDTSSLGDWYANRKKLPGGVKGISKKIHNMGLGFGIWVEPEMVSEDSDLYRAHPDWAMRIPGKPHSMGRNQMILDLANPDVCEHLITTLSELFEEGDIDYVKWDMNRTMSDVYSPYLSPEAQGETAHRYMMGLYHILEELTKRFPDILFEGCASGGNRFDLGMLCYFSQIWGSDDTDAAERVRIQTGYSYGYPMRTVSAHVSSVPNHQTLRVTPMDTRFDVAAFCSLGYELNLCDLNGKALDEIREQINVYKEWRRVFQMGRFYRGENLYDSNELTWNVVSPDKKRSAAMLFQYMAVPNEQRGSVRIRGLEEDLRYRFYSRPSKLDVRIFGDLINVISPIHIKNGSALHGMVSKIVKMERETEDVTVYGDTLSEAGVMLAPKFSSTGFNEKTRVFPDFSARLYFAESVVM